MSNIFKDLDYNKIKNEEEEFVFNKHKKLDERINKEGLPKLIPLKDSYTDNLLLANRNNTDFYYQANYIYEIKKNYIVQDKKKIIFSDDYVIDKFKDIHRNFNIVSNEKIVQELNDYKYEELITATKLDNKVFFINRIHCDTMLGLYYSEDGINFSKFNVLEKNEELLNMVSKNIPFIWGYFNTTLEPLNIKENYNVSHLSNLIEITSQAPLIIEVDDYDNINNMRYKMLSQQGAPLCIYQSPDLIKWYKCIDDEGKIFRIQDVIKNYNKFPNFSHKSLPFSTKEFNQHWSEIHPVGPLIHKERGDCNISFVKSIKNPNEYIITLRRPFEVRFNKGGPQRRIRFLKNSNFKENPITGWHFVDNLDLFLNPQPYEIRISLIDDIYFGVVNQFGKIYYPYLSTSRDGIYYDIRYFLDIPIRTIDNNNKFIRAYNLININNKNFFYFMKSNVDDAVYLSGSPTNLPIYASEIDLDRTFYITNNENKIGFIKTKNFILKSDNIKIIFDKISDEEIILNYKVYKNNGEEITNNLSNSLNDECYLEIVFMNIKLYGFEFI